MATTEMTGAEAKQRFRDEDEAHFGEQFVELYEYTPLLESIGEIKLRVDENEYQGDSYLLVVEGGRWGYLNFGWGSCSGCDALQACTSWDEVANLRNQLAREIHWESDPATLLDWMNSHDWKGDYVWSEPDFQHFLGEARSLLAGEPEKT